MSESQRAWLALILVVPAPSLGAFAALFLDPGGSGPLLFGLSKVWMLIFPWLWVVAVDREKLRWPRWQNAGLPAGLGGGAIMAAIIGGVFLAIGSDIDGTVIRDKVSEAGLSSEGRYLVLALYWSFGNSLIEEYLWRWFVATRCGRLMRRVPAALVAGLLFTLHHIVAMAAYLDWTFNVLASFGVLCGGVFWSWLYLRYRNIWAAWLSHAVADLAVFAVGYQLIFGS